MQERDGNLAAVGRPLNRRQKQQWEPGQGCSEDRSTYRHPRVRLDQAHTPFDAVKGTTLHEKKRSSIRIPVLIHKSSPSLRSSLISHLLSHPRLHLVIALN